MYKNFKYGLFSFEKYFDQKPERKISVQILKFKTVSLPNSWGSSEAFDTGLLWMENFKLAANLFQVKCIKLYSTTYLFKMQVQ